jgi:glycosyltransferase involved in cell wall biosynthesis
MNFLSDTVVVIPAWNEEKTIKGIIHQIRATTTYDIIVVDDASTDHTAEEAMVAGAHVLPLAFNLGAWVATQTGIRYAVKKRYKYLITMDADGQHLPTAIPGLLKPLWDGAADVVIGSCVKRGSRARMLAWSFFRRLTGLDINDLTSGFKAYNLQALLLLSTNQASLLEYQDIGVLLLLRRAKMRIMEVEVPMCPRESGSSKIFGSWIKVGQYMLLNIILSLSHATFFFPRSNNSAGEIE